MEDFIAKMPKIELHAHLNGSLSDATLNKLVELRKKSEPTYQPPNFMNYTEFRSLDECFEVFKLAHDLTDSGEAVKLACESVIKEFSEDGVVYLELRSTPRETKSMTREECIQAVVDTILLCRTKYPEIIVAFLPSINVAYGVDEAMKNFECLMEIRKKNPDIIRGLDLSGDPTKGKFSEVKHIFEKARADGFRIALHCAEVLDEEEIYEKLNFMRTEDRIGHGTFIGESNPKIWNLFREKKIPVEICLTSNVLCKSVSSYEEHHVKRLLDIKHPITICTDDYGVFKTSLSNEFKIYAETFKMTKNDLVELSINANKLSFATNLERQTVSGKIEKFIREQNLTISDEFH